MLPIRSRLCGGAAFIAAAVLLVAIPVTGQQVPDAPPAEAAPETPQSLLPDAFEAAPRAEAPPAGSEPPLLPAGQPPLLAPAEEVAEVVDPFAVPEPTGRDITVFGPLTPAAGGYGLATFAGSRGAFLAGLANRISGPIASRWASIVLRRALLSESAAPAGIAAGDWVAARALLLMRIGEIDGAKALVDAVPVDRYSARLYRVAGQVALAAADIGGLCPIAATGQLLSTDPLWSLAIAMCAAAQGDDITAARAFDDLRDDEKRVDPFDVRLGERIAVLAGGAGRASNIDWDEAPPLTPFRYGVATAAGVAIPSERLAALGPARFGWLVRNAAVAPAERLAAARPAAVLGTMSAAELTSAIAALSPADAGPETSAARLRAAFGRASSADRRAALRAIWSGAGTSEGYGALLETATAVAALPVEAGAAADSAYAVAALLAAGDAATARRWWPVADKAAPAVRAASWALLATGSGGVSVDVAAFADWRAASGADEARAARLLACLAGLGLAGGADWAALRGELLGSGGPANSWTRAIDAAGAAGRGGEVAMLAATGLQGAWSDVPPGHLTHILAALVRTGRGAEARAIAAEAMTRT